MPKASSCIFLSIESLLSGLIERAIPKSQTMVISSPLVGAKSNQTIGTARATATAVMVLGRKFAQMLDKPNNCVICFGSYFVVEPFWVSVLFCV